MNVWLSFEFTYLSNSVIIFFSAAFVWLSFEFTYLSNNKLINRDRQAFDYPLNLHISQTKKASWTSWSCLIILWIYISLKHMEDADHWKKSLIILWIYISLKLSAIRTLVQCRLIILWIYISLKQICWQLWWRNRLIILWIYISLKPQIWSTDYHSV